MFHRLTGLAFTVVGCNLDALIDLGARFLASPVVLLAVIAHGQRFARFRYFAWFFFTFNTYHV